MADTERLDGIHRWEMFEIILKRDYPDREMDRHLWNIGVDLADFVPEGYNNSQVARDSDGSPELDKVA